MQYLKCTRLLLIALLLSILFLSVSKVRAETPLCFDQTKLCISGRFRQYWEQNGGLAVFGYPITPARNERNRDTGQNYLTQWFERNRFELHPDKIAPYDVLLGRLGDERLLQQGTNRTRESEPIVDCLWFPQTGHNVCDESGGYQFKTYWQSNGLQDPQLTPYGKSLALLGLPLTEAWMETNSSGYFVMTQWFERGRLEWHPDTPIQPTRYTVLLGLLGREISAPQTTVRPGDLSLARGALTTFFSALNAGQYSDAAKFYGGSYQMLRNWNPDSIHDYAALWKGGCEINGLQCLKIRTVMEEEATKPREFRFVVEFSNEDGSLFRRGPCCGATEEQMPTQTQFLYIVTKIGEQFLVQGSPVYVP